MKSDNLIWIILLIVFLLLGVTEVFLYKQYEDNMDRLNNSSVFTTEGTNNNVLTTEDYKSISDSVSGDEIDVPDTHTYIFVGDSRYVAMSEFAQPNDTFFCENGVGLIFLKNNWSNILSKADSNTRIVIGLGVNDVGGSGIKGYIEALQDLKNSTDAEVYYMLVNPVKDDICRRTGYTITNQSIENFNTQILEGLNGSSIKIIDTYTFLTMNEFTTFDGLHYDDETTKNIYSFIKRCLKNQ